MSSRYGRNKKRRHRERIAMLERNLEHNGTVLRATEQQYIRARADLEQLVGAIEEIQPYSALLPPREVSWDSPQFQFERRRHPRRSLLRRHEAGPCMPMVTRDVVTLDMERVRAWVEGDRRTLERSIHLVSHWSLAPYSG